MSGALTLASARTYLSHRLLPRASATLSTALSAAALILPAISLSLPADLASATTGALGRGWLTGGLLLVRRVLLRGVEVAARGC